MKRKVMKRSKRNQFKHLELESLIDENPKTKTFVLHRDQLARLLREFEEVSVVAEFFKKLSTPPLISGTNAKGTAPQSRVGSEPEPVHDRIISNKAQCLKCLDIIESKHRHDFVTCKCKSVVVDGGHAYLKRSFPSGMNPDEAYLDLSVTSLIIKE